MLRDALLGATAGAAGTTALNITTYADMTLRGRPSSEVPAEVAGELAQRAGVDLGAGAADGDGDGARMKAQHRRSGLGSLMGYGVGLGLGLAYGALRPRLTLPGRLLAGGALGLAAMAASDAPATLLKKTDPTTWGAAGWLADIVPHWRTGSSPRRPMRR